MAPPHHHYPQGGSTRIYVDENGYPVSASQQPPDGSESDPILAMKDAIIALGYEVPQPVFLDLADRWNAVTAAHKVLTSENERLRAFRTAVEQACQPYYFNGIEVDGKTVHDVLDEIHAALDTLNGPSHKTATEPGSCGDPECHVLHADPANPIHPPFYVDSRTQQKTASRAES